MDWNLGSMFWRDESFDDNVRGDVLGTGHARFECKKGL